MAQIGFIGTGEIAEAMVKDLVGQGHIIYVSERSETRSYTLAKAYEDVYVLDNQGVLDQSDYICLCLMKETAEHILPKLRFRRDHKIISVMVDVSYAALTQLCAPATEISITIPLPFIATGQCPLPVFPDTGSVHDLFGGRNIILPVASEKALNAHFAATALASSTFAQMQTVSTWLGSTTGNTKAAEAYVIAMLGGYISSLPTDGQDRLAEALKALATEGGLNATLRAHMEQSSVLDILTDGLNTLKPRLGLMDQP